MRFLMTFLTLMFLSCCNNVDQNHKLSEPSLEESVKQIDSTILASLMTKKSFEILQNSDRAVYYSVKKDSSSENSYFELSAPQELSSSFLSEIRSLLAADNSYVFVSKSSSCFSPNLAIEMRAKKEKLVILIASGYKQVQFVQDGKQLTLELGPAFVELEKLINSLRRKKDE